MKSVQIKAGHIIILIFICVFLQVFNCNQQFRYSDLQNTNDNHKVHNVFYSSQNVRLQATPGCTTKQLTNIKFYVESCPQTDKDQIPICILDGMETQKQKWDIIVYSKNQTIGTSYWKINQCQVLLFGYGTKNYSYVMWQAGTISSNDPINERKQLKKQFVNNKNKTKTSLRIQQKQNSQNVGAVCNTTVFNALYNAIQLCTSITPSSQATCIKNKLYQTRGQYWDVFVQTKLDYASRAYWLIDNCFIQQFGLGQYLHDYFIWRTG